MDTDFKSKPCFPWGFEKRSESIYDSNSRTKTQETKVIQSQSKCNLHQIRENNKSYQ